MTLKRTTQLSTALAITALGMCESQAQTVTNAVPPPPSPWQTTAALGLTLTRGNSDTTTLSGSINSEKKWDKNDLSLGADGLYGTTKVAGTDSSVENAELAHGFIQYDRSFTERWYAYGRIDGLHDGIADIKYRITISPGIGYYFIKEKDTDLSAEVGPGFIDQKLGNTYNDYALLRIGEKFHHTLSDRARVWQTAEFLPQVDYFKNYIANFEVGIEADLNKKKNLALRCTLDDTYNNVPAEGRKKNDTKLITSIAYKF